MLKSIVLSPLYFPPIAYFTAISIAEKVIIDLSDQYQKQTYRNRCYILSSQKVDRLTVPVVGSNKKLPMNQLEIDYQSDWQKIHWRSIQSCYGKSAFYEHYAPYIKKLIFSNSSNLAAFNKDILTFCLDALKMEKEIIFSTEKNRHEVDELLDLKSIIVPKMTLEQLSFFKSVEYYQNFGNKFEPNLSIIDLLMCEGPNAQRIVKESQR